MTIQSLSRTTLTLVLLLTAHAFAAPAGAQIHNHGDTGLGMDHAMLTSSDPADGAELAETPRTLTLVFRHPVKLDTLALRSASGDEVGVAWSAERRGARHAIALPAMAAGVYWVSFTATADDGQTMPGVIHFTIARGAEPPRR